MDRVAVVAAAASGIGLARAERFAAEGMKVVMADGEAAALRPLGGAVGVDAQGAAEPDPASVASRRTAGVPR